MFKIDQPGLSLSRKTILKGIKDKLVQAYFNFMVDIAVAFGADKTRALKELKDTLEFEIKLANVSTNTFDSILHIRKSQTTYFIHNHNL